MLKILNQLARLINFKYLSGGLYLTVSVISLITPALYYGYPLFHQDCKTYFLSGYSNIIPYDRPIGYGWFLRLGSLSYSFWLVVIVQATILVFLIWVLCKYVLSFKNPVKATSLSTIIIAAISPASLYVSMLMPDIFSAYLILGFWIVFMAKKLPKFLYGIIFLLIIYCNFSHFSNIALSVFLTFLLILFALIKKETKLYKLSVYFIATVLISLGLLKITNNVIDGTKEISKGKNIILMARLVEMDIVPDYLEENDKDTVYSLTPFIDELRKMKSAADFVWNSKSPLFKGGCIEISHKNCWKEKSEEYGKLIKEIILSPRYTFRLTGALIKDSFKQFFSFNTKNHYYQNPEEYNIISNIISNYLPVDYYNYKRAVQMNTQISSYPINTIHKYIIGASFIGLLIFIIHRKKAPEFYESAILILILLYSNAFICSTLSNVIGRYQGRVIWLLPLLLVLYVIKSEQIKDK